MKLRELPALTMHQVGVDVSKKKKLRMAVTAKTFRVMSSTIYKYKIRAIIRELSTNAIDGHVMAGNNNPFDVQLPTVLDPRFIIRDYGTGLTPQMIEDVFIVYFESTKNDTNDQIGSLGLGAKSPMCYTDAFTVESVVDGMKRGYSIYMTPEGEPDCLELYEVETKEPNGMIITVPVMPEDVQTWEDEACRVYESFTTIRPNFIGVQPKINYQPLAPKEGMDYIVHRSKWYKGVFARMGSIIYPIDENLYHGTAFACYTNIQDSYIFDFPIGELDFMPSREELSLDKLTLKAVKSRFDKLNAGFDRILLAQFNKHKTVRQKLVWFNNLSSQLQGYLCKKPEFNVIANGEEATLGELLGALKDPNYTKNMRIWGFWANGYENKSCEYEKTGTGRWSSYKSETTKRQNIERLLFPWNQEKLILIEMDVTKQRPCLVGYSMLNGGRISFVEVCDSDNSRDKIEKLIRDGFFEEDDIIRLKASEMTAEVEAYEKDREHVKRETNYKRAPRPKTPTAYRYTRKNGAVVKEDLYLNKQDFLELPETNAIRLYGVDEYQPLGENGNFDIPRVVKSIDSVMNYIGGDIIVIRNSLWKYIPDSKMIDLDEVLTKLMIKTSKAMNSNWYPCKGRESRDKVMKLHGVFGVTLEKLVKNRYNEKHYKVLDYLVNKTLFEFDSPKIKNKDVREAVVKHHKERSAMDTRTDAAWKKFEEMNQFHASVIKMMANRYNMEHYVNDPKSVDHFRKTIRWK